MGWRRMEKQIGTRRNRLTQKARSITKHTGDSVPFIVHAKRMETYIATLSHKYGEDSSSQLELDSHAWTKAIGGMIITRTYVYGFGSQGPATTILNDAVTSELVVNLCIGFNIRLKEKVKNLSNDMSQMREQMTQHFGAMNEFIVSMKAMMIKRRSRKGHVSSSSLASDKFGIAGR
ncbi:PREDICTED: uncharacterized protein LOC18609366 [Theobroma cacao]|uniref:Uncharacterized protein LOC18609366 n=1 Tax=Theobroma cacao TaxID=3641 RepID=A0AB32VX82_THECC|nr:PREDICTED: uncharacterized protein LOC18609366 [Theobroma cacao]XP_017970531.1 PREDICTED: uncharacterized protein LOC18609366 [Theobroma cacao]XP_017970532.1 PREDICTED: uncharacterized protein LOC18609366 [Theobroma cacao]XP_017970533.1 PREDICTED: uncharacterized protein LOC18609366 [Theobroma cacao]